MSAVSAFSMSVAGKANLAGAARCNAHDRFEDRALARPIGPEQRHDLAFRDGEADASDRLNRPVGNAKIVDFEHAGSYCAGGTSSGAGFTSATSALAPPVTLLSATVRSGTRFMPL